MAIDKLKIEQHDSGAVFFPAEIDQVYKINELVDAVNTIKNDLDSFICDYSERKRIHEGRIAQLYDCLNACRAELKKAGLNTDETYPSYIDEPFMPSINDLTLKATFCVSEDAKLSIFLKELENLAKQYGVFLATYNLKAEKGENNVSNEPR